MGSPRRKSLRGRISSRLDGDRNQTFRSSRSTFTFVALRPTLLSKHDCANGSRTANIAPHKWELQGDPMEKVHLFLLDFHRCSRFVQLAIIVGSHVYSCCFATAYGLFWSFCLFTIYAFVSCRLFLEERQVLLHCGVHKTLFETFCCEACRPLRSTQRLPRPQVPFSPPPSRIQVLHFEARARSWLLSTFWFHATMTLPAAS